MTSTQQGQCHCGNVKLSFPSDATFTFSCHCEDCKRLVSGGRLLGFAIPDDQFSVEGNTAQYNYDGGSGKNIALSFCPTCSTQLFARPDALENTIVVRSNALENPNSFAPEKFLFAEQACAWDHTTNNKVA